MWLTAAEHTAMLQFNDEESFLVQVAGGQRIRLYDPMQTPFLYRTTRSEVQCHLANSVSTNRLISVDECPWLDAELPKGTVLFRQPSMTGGAAMDIKAPEESDQDGMITACTPCNQLGSDKL